MDKFAVISKESIIIKDLYPETTFVKDMYWGFPTYECVIEELKARIAVLLYSLREEEKKVLTLLYGIGNNKPMNKEEIANELQLTLVQVDAMKKRGIARMRNPIQGRRRLINYQKPSFNYIYSDFDDTIAELKKRVLKEIETKLSRSKKNIYLSNILNRYNIEIEVGEKYNYEDEYLSKLLNKYELSERSYNILKSAGINTLSELKKVYDNKAQLSIKNIERNSYEELETLVDNFFYKDESLDNEEDQFSCSVDIAGNKTVYQYPSDNEEKISETILKKLIQYKPGSRNIFESEFSPGLIDILLMKGYLFEDDVVADGEVLRNQFTAFGFDEFAHEIDIMQDFYNSSGDLSKVYAVFDDEMVQLIISNDINSLNELIKLKKLDSEKLNKIKKISDYLTLTEEDAS